MILPAWILFFSGYVNDRLYEIPVPDLATLRRRIVAVVRTVDVAKLQRVWMELEYHLDILRETRGSGVDVKKTLRYIKHVAKTLMSLFHIVTGTWYVSL